MSQKPLSEEIRERLPHGGRFEKLDKIKTRELSAREEATSSTEITPEEGGLCTIHAYLYDDNRRIRSRDRFYLCSEKID